MILFAITVFLSSLLLFQVQPIIGRYILPWFGGTPAVWSTCILFFQLMLLVGYAYAHVITRRLSVRAQSTVHVALLLVAVVCLPITPGDDWKPTGGEDPTLAILLLLAVHVGVPYLAVSTTAPLLQRWLTYSDPDRSPYRLYALSNLGSLIGLLSYPFLVEPWLPVGRQTFTWSLGFVAFALACGFVAARLSLRGKRLPPQGDVGTKPPRRKLWVALAACGSVMLLATTNQLCRDVAVVPFLWVLPLALYLTSFIISFESQRWYDRRFWAACLVPSFAGVVYLLYNNEIHIVFQIPIYSVALLSACMVCHGELARLKPAAEYLTSFYLMISLGGALGGAFVAFGAPLLFSDYWELHLSLVATVGLFAFCVLRHSDRLPSPRWVAGAFAASMLALVAGLGSIIYIWSDYSIVTRRSFFAVWRVYESDVGTERWQRELWHGGIQHGAQWMQPEDRAKPVNYYGPDSGDAVALRHHPKRRGPLHVGVLGLGSGTLAVHGTAGDRFRFYEIDPVVVDLANDYFYYLSDTEAEVEIALGDARISLEQDLEQEGSLGFDLIVIDVFSGDAIPVHLLTREAFALYWAHLESDGVLAVHISNGHVDLGPVVRTLAAELGKSALWMHSDEDPVTGLIEADWVLVTSNREFLDNKEIRQYVHQWPTSEPQLIAWRDDYANLIEVLK